MMDVREIELGGVYNLGNYENLRISVRVAARPGRLGETLAELAETVDKLAEIAAALRKAASGAREKYEAYERLIKEAERYEERAVEAKEKIRSEARKRLEPIIDKLAPEIRAILEKEPEKAWELGVLDKSCVYLRDYNEYIEEARKHRELAEKQLEEAKQLNELRSRIIQLLRSEKIEEAYKLAKHINRDHEDEEEVRQ